MGPCRAQGVNLFPGASWQSCCCSSPALWPAGMAGCGTRCHYNGWASRLHEVVLLDPESQSLSNTAHIQGKEVPDTAVIYILILDLCEIFVWPSETFVLSWFVSEWRVWLCTQVCRKYGNTGIKRAKSRQLCTMTLLLNQSQGGWFGFIPCRKLWECHNGHGWGVGWMFCCGWCLTQSETNPVKQG